MPSASIDYQKRVCLAMNFISQNLARDLSLEEIAAAAALSPFHFHRIFKAVVGETVGGFTRRLRLEAAANRLIAGSQGEITHIAFTCGFSSSQNFAKAFRQHFGTTPSAYRRSKIGNKARKDENVHSLQVGYPETVFKDRLPLKMKHLPDVEVQEMPDLRLAYVRVLGPYSPATCQAPFARLMQWAVPRGLVGPGKVLSIYWDNPEVTPPDRCRFDACLAVPDGSTEPLHTQTLSGGLYAVCHFEGEPGDIQPAWEEAFAWLCASGYECSEGPCFERYHNFAGEHPRGRWIFDVCIPLRG